MHRIGGSGRVAVLTAPAALADVVALSKLGTAALTDGNVVGNIWAIAPERRALSHRAVEHRLGGAAQGVDRCGNRVGQVGQKLPLGAVGISNLQPSRRLIEPSTY